MPQPPKSFTDQIRADTEFKMSTALASQFEAARTYHKEPLGLSTYDRPLFDPALLLKPSRCCCPCHVEHEEDDNHE